MSDGECRARRGRALDQLPELIAIALWRPHVLPALEDDELGLLLGVQVEAIAVKNAAMNDEAVPRGMAVQPYELSISVPRGGRSAGSACAFA